MRQFPSSAPIEVTEQRLRIALRVGHHPEDVALLIHHPRDGGQRTVGIVVHVAKGHLSAALQTLVPLLVDEITAIHVGDGEPEGCGTRQSGGETVRPSVGAKDDVAAEEVFAGIEEERSGEETGLGQNLKAVANAQHGPALPGKGRHLFHHRGESGDGTTPEVVTVAESARQDDVVTSA
jgi:hypothetical protein